VSHNKDTLTLIKVTIGGGSIMARCVRPLCQRERGDGGVYCPQHAAGERRTLDTIGQQRAAEMRYWREHFQVDSLLERIATLELENAELAADLHVIRF
jgi:hypothetical protein